MIIPRTKHEKYTGAYAVFGSILRVHACDFPGERALKLFRYFIPAVPVLTVERVAADIVFECIPAVSREDEYYKITVNNNQVTVCYRSFAGARNAAASVAQLLAKSDDNYKFPVAEIQDLPDSKMRSFMIDPARGIIPVQTVKEILIRMAMVKYNYLHIHLSDSGGYAIKSDVLPKLSGPDGKQYSKDEIREIVAFAGMLGIECIPEAEFPGHANRLLQDMEELGCVTENEKQSPFVICAGNEHSYDMLEKLYTEIAELFPGGIIHVGTDEIAMRDLVDLYTWPTWHDCARCHELCEREGMDRDNYIEIFYYMLRRVYKIISGLGRRIMMWNENIDISKSPELPRDILIHFWRIAGTNRGPVEGCSME
ncbi:MAG: family 20 glycosylhydrolase, partial [Eubacteriales bacterium]|nr:family 20 glycosylhydrolase [Eubacteriales bacterium]